MEGEGGVGEDSSDEGEGSGCGDAQDRMGCTEQGGEGACLGVVHLQVGDAGGVQDTEGIAVTLSTIATTGDPVAPIVEMNS